MFPIFISKKFSFSRRDSKFISFISSVSIIGIALGVATLIIALSILNGFERTITNKIVDFESHIQITSYQTALPDYKNNLQKIKELLGPFYKEINPYASNLAIIGNRNKKEGINIKGIIPENNADIISKNIVEGIYQFKGEEFPGIIIGKKLADKLFLKVGDKVTVFALANDQIPSAENLPNIEKYEVTALFESGMAEFDDLYAYVDLKNAQQLFEIGDQITGYDIRINNLSKADSLASLLNSELRYPHSARSIFQIHRNIFTWIELQKEPIPIVLGLIIIVAAFNIIGTLLMIVLEKTNAIGTLKALGARNRQIILIFILQGIFLAIIGIFLGNILALILMFIQQQYNIISLPSSVYFMSTVPIELSLNVFIGISFLTFILCILVSWIPSYVASKIKPVSSLRFN